MADSSPTTTVLIVDDHPLVADALHRLMTSARDLHVVEVVGTAAAAVQAASEHRPRVVIMDFHLPGGSGAEAARTILAASPGTAVLFLSGDDAESVVAEAIGAGASGFLYKASPPGLMIEAVRRIAAGETLISTAARAQMYRKSRSAAATAAERARTLEELTAREKEVLTLVCEGRDNQDIADALGIGLTTTRWHIRNVLGKLGSRSKWEASVRAAELGFGRTPGAAEPS
ncbi:MAG: response regulator transcription factor [Candidatus Dormibacteria bacterium]